MTPVDVQIARGVKAGNRPADETPFGGYRGWQYFHCLPYDTDSEGAHEAQAALNADALARWASEHGLDVEVME